MPTSEFNERLWFNWPQPAVPQLLDLTFEACGEPFRNAFGIPCYTSILYYRGERSAGGTTQCQANWLLRESEGAAVGRLLVDMVLRPSFAAHVETAFDQACQAILDVARVARDDSSALDLPEMLDLVDDLRTRFLKYYALGAITEPIQWHCQAVIDDYLVRHETIAGAPGTEQAKRTRAALFTMTAEPYAFARKRSLLRMAMMHEHGTVSGSDVTEHLRSFDWIPTNYERAVTVTAEEVWSDIVQYASADPGAQLAEMETARQEDLAERDAVLKRVSHQIRLLADIADRFGSSMADRRKEVMNPSLVGLSAVANAVASAIHVDPDDFAMFSPSEARALAAQPDRVAAEAPSRRLAYVLVLSPSPLDDPEMSAALQFDLPAGHIVPRATEPTMADGQIAKQLLDELDISLGFYADADGTSVVRGDVVDVVGVAASQIAGTCRVVRDPLAQAAEFESGEILVATSTTPDFVPLMQQAAAIVTDMGGMLQHAAHFAREQRIPCIVGAGFATSAFATGDEIALDLNTGEVTRVLGEQP